MWSVDANRKRSSMRVPPSCSASRTSTDVTGSSSFGDPSALAKPSMKASDRGASTDVTRHQPRERSPSGPVMKYAASPPAARSYRSKVAGCDGGPHQRSSFRGSAQSCHTCSIGAANSATTTSRCAS